MPDMTRYAGDGAGIKAITGGDKVSIDPKHKAPYSTRIQAVVLAGNDSNLLIVFYVQIMPDDLVMQLHRF